MIIVEVYYDADLYFGGFDSELDEIASKYEGSCSYSGMGFGERDIGFSFSSPEQAENFRVEIQGRDGIRSIITKAS